MNTTLANLRSNRLEASPCTRGLASRLARRTCSPQRVPPSFTTCSLQESSPSGVFSGKGVGVTFPVGGFHLQQSTLTWPLRFWNQSTGNSGFGPSSTCADVLQGRQLNGKVILVTGAGTGLGRVAAQSLATAGAHVIAVGRSTEQLAGLLADASDLPGKVTPMTCDLSVPGSIDLFAREFLQLELPLHCLMNNAGVAFASPDTKSADGLELQFATNHLGTYRLTQLLMPTLKATGTKTNMARVVNVSSGAHAGGIVPTMKQVRKYSTQPNVQGHKYSTYEPMLEHCKVS